MRQLPANDVKGLSCLEWMWEDNERVFVKGRRDDVDGHRSVLVVFLSSPHPAADGVGRLAHEFDLRNELDGAWSARPLELGQERTFLVLEAPDGEPLDPLIGVPMETGIFLRLAIALSAALGQMHERGLVHKDIKPSNVLVNAAVGKAWLTGFGIASRLHRERQSPDPPEFIAGTLAYMAPEQTGRMNRSIDSRSDLYALGVTFYQMLTGGLPFTASDPTEWVYCHVAKRPTPPNELVESVPSPISAIVMKLLAKTAEERYQTASGLERDLRRCLADWEARGSIKDFFPGQQDMPDRPLIPEKLYGRAHEVEALLASFDRTAKSGTPELVLVSGYAGIGKSSVVNELHKALVTRRGLFAAGKFDQYKRGIPYATLAQAFAGLVRPLLSKSDVELSVWRDALVEALGTNGQLMVEMVPEIKLIIGEQPPVPNLSPQDAQRRFQLVFRRFIGVFARPEHPLALFLDDLQWSDAATLDLLEDVLVQSDVRHLMLVGAYRDNEVNAAHPLTRKLEAIRKFGSMVQTIVLAPLAREDLEQLLADSLHCTPQYAAPLAHLLHDKTAGNPFFAIQFLSLLAEEGLLTCDHHEARWSWALDQIHAKGYTENVADLMVEKLRRLPSETQLALQQLACLGNSADVEQLVIAQGNSIDEMHSALFEATRAGLVVLSDKAYRFNHDRIQEAAYSLIPEESRAAAHLRIGRLLASHTPPERCEETIFEVVNQFNRGAGLITSQDERDQLAKLNLIAGKRAKASTAYAAALTYFVAGAVLLAEDAWARQRDLVFSLELQRAECELQIGQSAAAENRLAALSTLANSTSELASVTCVRVDLYTILNQFDRAVAVCLDYLRHLGIKWSPHPTKEEVRREYDHIWSLLGDRSIEIVVDLPLMTDPTSLSTMDVLTRIISAVFIADENLSSLVICRMLNLSLEYGNTDASCFAYVWFGIISGARFGNYKAGWDFGQSGYVLVEKRGLKRYQARTYMCFGNMVLPWIEHIRTAKDLLNRAFEIAKKEGDLTFAAYGSNYLVTNLIAAGDPLAEVQRQAEDSLEFAKKVGFGLVIDNLKTQLGFIRTLRGLTQQFGSFEEPGFDELSFERHLAGNRVLAPPEFRYWVRKLQASFFAGEYTAAVAASSSAQRVLWSSTSHFEAAEFCFYAALSHAASWDFVLHHEKQRHLDALLDHRKQLRLWTQHCPENFENRAALVEAEIARIENRILDAERLYELAIHSARVNGFVHNEAIACEVAARFYLARGFERFADAYLSDARDAYLSWGAEAKVQQLEERYPQLKRDRRRSDPTNTILTTAEHLDLATITKFSQIISGEIVLERLVDALMRTAIEHAGAERGLLILARRDEHRIVAEATARGEGVNVISMHSSVTAMDLPRSVVNYVVRTKETVLLQDALGEKQFSDDVYIQQHRARSILCLPLLKNKALVGALYFENNLAARVFTPERIVMLKLLASQAAISLENTRLYEELLDREARIRRLIDSNIIGIFMWDLDGRVMEANDAFLRVTGYDRVDLIGGHLRWRDLTPNEWRASDDRRVEQLKSVGTARPYEKEYFRKDGSRVPVLVGAALFEKGGTEGVGFVLDLSEQKRADEAVRRSEERYRQVQMDLAHANRVSAAGHLSASIAHEINQPLGAAVTYANAALRWLGARPPNLERVGKALEHVIDNNVRAGEVIDRLRAFFKRSPVRQDRLEINQVILEVVALIRSKSAENNVLLNTQLAKVLPAVRGDRVQLQQVILNLFINAIEAMSEASSTDPRELRISTEGSESSGIRVSVRDSGPGLSPDTAERLFEAFYTTKPDGLGIGLSISRSIIEAHRGQLRVTTNAPRGAVFEFTLPAYSDNEPNH